ncbi:MAG TPA: RNA polymerase factor sigma-32 [Polyangiaceae bacterium]|nr:RNA polymerase factor sigma-32 [Polyangiaceae bacterium]
MSKKKTAHKADSARSADDAETPESSQEGDGADDGAGDGDSDLNDEQLAEQAAREAASERSDAFASTQLREPLRGSTALARSDPLTVYMREVERHALLSREDEHTLAVHYAKTGDVDAAARLVTANLRLVVKLAYEYRRAYRNMMDLIQEGNIGLMQAVKRYDPYRGVKLSSYAAWWIRAYMLRYILNNWRMVKLGTTQAQRKLFFNLNKEKARLTAMGIEPTSAEIAASLQVDERDVVEMDRRLARSDASLDAPVGDGEGRQTSRMELLPTGAAGPDRIAETAELSDALKGHLEEFRKTLKGKELEIFERRLVADEPMTLQELGDHFGISRERIRQLEARITGKLREYLRDKLGDAVEVA